MAEKALCQGGDRALRCGGIHLPFRGEDARIVSGGRKAMRSSSIVERMQVKRER